MDREAAARATVDLFSTGTVVPVSLGATGRRVERTALFLFFRLHLVLPAFGAFGSPSQLRTCAALAHLSRAPETSLGLTHVLVFFGLKRTVARDTARNGFCGSWIHEGASSRPRLTAHPRFGRGAQRPRRPLLREGGSAPPPSGTVKAMGTGAVEDGGTRDGGGRRVTSRRMAIRQRNRERRWERLEARRLLRDGAVRSSRKITRRSCAS